jgi:hypothetical protein
MHGTINAEVAKKLERARRMLTCRRRKLARSSPGRSNAARPRAAVGRDAKVTALIERLAPVSYWKIPALPAPRRTIRASSLAFRCGMNARVSRTTAPKLS